MVVTGSVWELERVCAFFVALTVCTTDETECEIKSQTDKVFLLGENIIIIIKRRICGLTCDVKGSVAWGRLKIKEHKEARIYF